jgi:hypothetical protein
MRNALWSLTAAVSLILLASCGGGSGSNVPVSPPAPQSFTVSVSPSSLIVKQGGAQSVNISVTGQNGFNGSAVVTLPAVPSGITVSPSSISLAPGTSGSFSLSASSYAVLQQGPLQFQGVSGALSGSATMQLTVQGNAVADPFHRVGGELVNAFYDASRQLLFAPIPV